MKPTSVFQTVSVIGLGYVGLPTAATIATRGINVIGVDIDEAAVKTINTGGSHIVETDLDVVLQAAVVSGKLKAATRPEPADAFVIAVPTPITPDKRSDLRAVEAAFRSIAPVLAKGNAAKGKTLAYTCTGCHGIAEYKNAYPSYRVPKIGGQSEAYIIAALNGYKKGERNHPTMKAQAQSFSAQDIADIAAYLSGLKPAAK